MGRSRSIKCKKVLQKGCMGLEDGHTLTGEGVPRYHGTEGGWFLHGWRTQYKGGLSFKTSRN